MVNPYPALLLCLAMASSGAHADEAPIAFVPADASEILEHIPAAYAQVQRNLQPSSIQVADLIERGAAAGDPRLLGRAESAIDHLAGATGFAETQLARAWLLQHRHDFSGALQVLDALLAQQRLPAALAARAQIHLVQGHLEAVRRDCAALLIAEPSAASLCAAHLAARRGNVDGAMALLERWLVEHAATPPAMRRAVLVRSGELALAQQRIALSDQRFVEALALAPADVRTLAARSRALRAQRRFEEVLTLLEPDPAVDTLLLERTLAAQAIHTAELTSLTERLVARYALLRARGEIPELREEAEFELSILDHPLQARDRAVLNFKTQRDSEDADILFRAANAAGDTTTLRELADWSRSQAIVAATGTPR